MTTWPRTIRCACKTIANFRKDNGKAICNACRQFIVVCHQLDLFSDAVVPIDGSKFKAVNSSDRNFTDAKLNRRMQEIEANIGLYLAELDTADRQEPVAAQSKSVRLNDKIASLKSQLATLKQIEARLEETGETQISLSDPDARSMMTRGSGIVGCPRRDRHPDRECRRRARRSRARGAGAWRPAWVQG